MPKSKYHTHVEPKLLLAEGWARDGLTDEQIAKNLGISYTTLKDYKKKYPTFSATLKKGKEVVDYEVENALLKRAIGYYYDEVTQENGIETKRVTKQVAPDVTAQIFWLKNRKADKWRDKRDGDDKEIKVDDKPFELPARVIAPSFLEVHFDIIDKSHREYVLDGGRGSTKSTFVGLEIINLIKNNPNIHALATRKVADTLRDSVYAQIKWAIEILGLENEFRCGLSPLEIEYLPTKQKIYFRGADDPVKIKSIKPAFGYIGILWLEELDQFKGPEAVRSIEQSAIRGGDEAYIFKTFNPPKTSNNWANKYIKIPKENQFQKHTTYLEVPQKWLGKTFIDEAEHLKNVNPKAYEHEYLGIANGNGGNVFENVTIRVIEDEEIKQFDRLYFGLDFGWFPDPNAYTKMYYNSAQRKLYIIDEFRSNKMANKDLANILIKEKGLTPNDKLVCDSADNKSIADLKSYGLFTRGAEKGPGSVDYSMKWLASLTEIIIDNSRCPHTAQEFLDYEYERTKDGEIVSGYPDKNNHFIDSVRYATNEIWKRRGQ